MSPHDLRGSAEGLSRPSLDHLGRLGVGGAAVHRQPADRVRDPAAEEQAPSPLDFTSRCHCRRQPACGPVSFVVETGLLAVHAGGNPRYGTPKDASWPRHRSRGNEKPLFGFAPVTTASSRSVSAATCASSSATRWTTRASDGCLAADAGRFGRSAASRETRPAGLGRRTGGAVGLAATAEPFLALAGTLRAERRTGFASSTSTAA